MEKVALTTPDWQATAYIARGFVDRLLGVRRAPEGSSIVLQTSSVHAFGRRLPLEVFGMDAEMRVVASKTLRPNRIVVMPSARLIVELPAGRPLPAIGDRVALTDG